LLVDFVDIIAAPEISAAVNLAGKRAWLGSIEALGVPVN
jgi:hypothetical protein